MSPLKADWLPLAVHRVAVRGLKVQEGFNMLLGAKWQPLTWGQPMWDSLWEL
jgi:hypothetical protein